ncbi:MAG: heme exporter protein CcmB [Pseudomonadota bacterium]|nr:heme exporter protein CcmB [Pseudomonadota bacterium]
MELLHQCISVLRKDLLQQWRSRARLVAVGVFGLTTLLLFSFANGPDSTMLRANAAGYLWLALLLCSTLSLAESFRIEMQNGALEGLLLLPTDPRAIYYGKALANLAVLTGLGLALIPVMVALYDTSIPLGVHKLAGVIALGAAGLVAPGTLYSALAARARGSDVLLPLLLFPLVVPALLSCVKATSLILSGDPMSQLGSWVGLLVAFNVIYWSLCGLLFGRVVED